jgi:mRNA (guanine-N7-)-methyltransferase
MTEKRKRDDDAAAAAAAASDAEAARNVALHYSGRDNQSTAQRKQSPIYHLRCLNNWVRFYRRDAPRRDAIPSRPPPPPPPPTPPPHPNPNPNPNPLNTLLAARRQIKSTIISAYVRKGDRVLDFACGKGGDLPKFRKASIGSYAGIDIALESVRRDAVTRYNAAGYPFPASFIAGDGFAIDLTEHLPPASFDVISCQARSIHWSPYGRVRVVDADP